MSSDAASIAIALKPLAQVWASVCGMAWQSTIVAVASKFEDEAMAVAQHAARGKAVTCDLSQPGDKLRHLIEEADVVVSLLPAPMHAMVAMECITLKKDLVTASYESDEMRALRCR